VSLCPCDRPNVADQSGDLDLFAHGILFIRFFLPIKVKQNRVAQSADRGERCGVDVFAFRKILQAGNNLVAGCENDGERALPAASSSDLVCIAISDPYVRAPGAARFSVRGVLRSSIGP
jgi:hypothetical protein